MAAITKKDTRLKLQFVANVNHSIHAGLVVVEAMSRRVDLWHKLRKLSCLNPRKDRMCGFGPEVIVGQLIYPLCSGGGCLSDSQALNDDPLACEFLCVGKFADQSEVEQWLREQSEESVAALRQLLHQFVAWVWQWLIPSDSCMPANAMCSSMTRNWRSAGRSLKAWHYLSTMPGMTRRPRTLRLLPSSRSESA